MTGAPGLGKRHLARCLSEFLLCQQPSDSSACGGCKSCQLLHAGSHPDMHWLEPEEGSKVIKIDQIRVLNHFLAQTSQQGGYRVAVVAPAEAMNVNAANALLKNLEEPGANTLLVLVSDTPSRVMPTLRSRCQALALAVPSLEEACRWLQPLAGDHAAESLLAMTGGAPLAARDLLAEGRLEARLSFAQDLLDIAEGKMFSVQAASRWLDTAPLLLIESLLAWLQSASRQEAGVSLGERLEVELQLLARLEQSQSKLRFRLYDKLLLAKKQLLSGANPNAQLLLEEVAMDWQAVMKVA